MSNITVHHLHTPRAIGWLRALADQTRQLAAALRRRRDLHRTEVALAALPEHVLRDIGVQRVRLPRRAGASVMNGQPADPR